MEKYKNLLTSTTLIPLWAKAVESESDDPILMDNNAYPMLKKLGYDLDFYDKKKQNPSQVGCCLRAKWIDDETLKFVNKHQSCQVIQLGAGIDDRFRRISMPKGIAHWYDLDLKEVAEMRRAVIPEVDRNEILSMDMLDPLWMKRLKANNLPTLIIIEGVLMYFEEVQIEQLFCDIGTHLDEATVLFDSIPANGVGKAKYHDSVKKYNKGVEYTWSVKNEDYLKATLPEVDSVEIVRMSDLPKSNSFMFILRMMYKIPYFYRNFNQLLVKADVKKSEL